MSSGSAGGPSALRPVPTDPKHQGIEWGEMSPDNDHVACGSYGSAGLPAEKLATPEVSGFWTPPRSDVEVDKSTPALQSAGVIFGADDRQPVSNSTQLPWREACSLQITFPGGVELGTGVMIGPRAVATAAHCVYSHEKGGKAQSIVVIPGRNGLSSVPFGRAIADHFVAPLGWTDQDAQADPETQAKSPYDYAVILLPTDLGTTTGWFSLGALTNGSLVKRMANHIGYPSDKDPACSTQWWSQRVIDAVGDFRLYYFFDTAPGDSGGPVYILNSQDQSRVLVGIHTSYDGQETSALRINDQVLANLLDWRDRANSA